MPKIALFTTETLSLIALVFVLAGFVKGVVGMGLPTVAIGLLGVFMTPVQAAALLVIPSLVTNVWQLLAGPSLSRISRRLATMMLGILVGTIACAGLISATANDNARLALGVALMVYAGLGLSSITFAVSPGAERWCSPLVGAVTGAISAVTGVFVVPAVAYLQALQLNKEDTIQALGLSFTVSTIGLAIALGSHGHFDAILVQGSMLALVPALLGMWIGTVLRKRISASTFRRVFLIGLAALGAHLAYSSLR